MLSETQVVAGCTPGRGGTDVFGVPVFDTVREAVARTQPTASIIFVPPAGAAGAILEAADAGLEMIVCITEGIPALDMLRVKWRLAGTSTRLVGPNCPGVITPGQCKAGIMPAEIHRKGHVGVVSRSGTLTYEAVHQLTAAGIGQSTVIGIGGDSILGLDFTDCLALFEKDSDTYAVVLIGEIGGCGEEEAAAFLKSGFSKPVAAYIAGITAPQGKRMGHAGAISSNGRCTAAGKIAALRGSGATVADAADEIGAALIEALRSRGLYEACLTCH
jgi:succinyl-CoA synthetase alpha subunit